jgi:tRNA U34 2-thiouridine synthase MnmA/TrmU
MKALAVFSGGLDSMVAAALMRSLEIEVLGLFFETPFFSSAKARESAETIRLPLKIIDITSIHLEVLKNPRHGYGANMNPCIDCHTLMLSQAGRMLEKEGADFIFTGEVLGQRPMSQHRRALSIVEAGSGFGGLVLRPLSARLLPPTIPERNGWVNRQKLLDLSGRSRKPQMALADGFGIRNYPSSGGGCLLTDVIFSRRLRDLLSSKPHVQVREIELLKVGRHFRISPQTKLVVGRNQKENETICALASEEDLLSQTVDVPGPVVLAAGEISEETEELAAALTVCYSDARTPAPVEVEILRKGAKKTRTDLPRPKDHFRRLLIR